MHLQVALYCDVHGHSRKHGAFMYGCQQSPAPQVSLVLHAEQVTFVFAQSNPNMTAFFPKSLLPCLLLPVVP